METATASLAVPLGAWVVLAVVVAISLTIDLVVHRGDRGLGRRRALVFSAAWITLAVAFGGWIALQLGGDAAEDYFTAYLVEKTLSVDNLFVFLVVFEHLKIPRSEQHRVLHWGILGAFVTRAVFIASGAALLEAWHDAVYVLGGFLIVTGIRMLREKKVDGEGRILTFVRRHLAYTPRLHGHSFVAVEDGRRVATPLLLALIVIELTDILFAIDSIPAAFAVTREPFLVYSSNVFAALGLRALYLVLADLLADLAYLRYGLAAILVFAGGKLLASSYLHVPHAVSLLAVVSIVVASIIPSVVARRRAMRRAAAGHERAPPR